MPLKLDIKKKFSQRSERVKGVDIHPTDPWLLANLYNGHVCIYNYVEGSLVKSFEAADLPARCAKFVARKQWAAIGSDDMFIRVYNYNTMDRVKMFEAHTDYIRSIAVHPSLSYLLSCSDDMLIKLWDWDKGFTCTQVFEGHVHYVMQVVFNPKDTSTFASASLDRTVKVWSIGQPAPNFTLEGHEKGVNCVDYFTGGDRPYLVSGADDKMCKVWDYQTKACVHTLEGHTQNVSAVCFHPELPIIISGSEDGSIKIWHNTTYRLEQTINYGMERVWALGYVRGSNAVSVGYDEGVVLLKMGNDEPVVSMDASGKIVYARHSEIQMATVKALGSDHEAVDGERLPLPVKDLGSSEVFASSLRHNSNGRFVVLCGDGEYVVYTALAWRSKSFGSAAEFVWSTESNDFAVRQTKPDVILVHKNFKEVAKMPLHFTPSGITGGPLIGVRASDHVSFYDWASQKCVRRIDVSVESVYWNASGDMLALVTSNSFYLLRFHTDLVSEALASGKGLDEDGVEDAFEVVTEISDRVRSGLWVGDCFIYNNASWRLNYCVGGEVTVMYHLDRPMYLLGYIVSHQRVYLMDREFGVVSYSLLLSLVEFKTLIMRDESEQAFELLESIPDSQKDSVAKFLESRGFVTKALEVAHSPDYKFELAVQLHNFEVAMAIAEQLASESRWKQLGEIALADGHLALAEQCLQKSKDFAGMMLMYSVTGNRKGMEELAYEARQAGKHNVAFLANFVLQNLSACIDTLVGCERLPEAAYFALTYCPSKTPDLVKLWQGALRKVNAKAAEALANPEEYPNLFTNWEKGLEVEAAGSALFGEPVRAAELPQHEEDLSRDLIAMAFEAARPAVNGVQGGAEDANDGDAAVDAGEAAGAVEELAGGPEAAAPAAAAVGDSDAFGGVMVSRAGREMGEEGDVDEDEEVVEEEVEVEVDEDEDDDA